MAEKTQVSSIPLAAGIDQRANQYVGEARLVRCHNMRLNIPGEMVLSPGYHSCDTPSFVTTNTGFSAYAAVGGCVLGRSYGCPFVIASMSHSSTADGLKLMRLDEQISQVGAPKTSVVRASLPSAISTGGVSFTDTAVVPEGGGYTVFAVCTLSGSGGLVNPVVAWHYDALGGLKYSTVVAVSSAGASLENVRAITVVKDQTTGTSSLFVVYGMSSAVRFSRIYSNVDSGTAYIALSTPVSSGVVSSITAFTGVWYGGHCVLCVSNTTDHVLGRISDNGTVAVSALVSGSSALTLGKGSDTNKIWSVVNGVSSTRTFGWIDPATFVRTITYSTVSTSLDQYHACMYSYSASDTSDPLHGMPAVLFVHEKIDTDVSLIVLVNGTSYTVASLPLYETGKICSEPYRGSDGVPYLAWAHRNGPLTSVQLIQIANDREIKIAATTLHGRFWDLSARNRCQLVEAEENTVTGTRTVMMMSASVDTVNTPTAGEAGMVLTDHRPVVTSFPLLSSSSARVSMSVEESRGAALVGGGVPFLVGESVSVAGTPFSPITVTYGTDASTGGLPVGTYLYTTTFDMVDASGNRWESHPSQPLTVTITDPTANVKIYPGAPPYVTGGKTIPFNIYRTTVGGTVFYKVTQAYSWAYTDTTSDTELITHKMLYCQGENYLSGTAPNWGCPPHTASWTGKNRVIVGGLESRNQVQWSKTFVTGEAVSFTHPSADQWRADFGAEVVAVAAVDDAWIVFGASKVWAVFGDGPGDTATGDGKFSDIRVLSSSVGAVHQGSVVEGDAGIYFQARDGNIYVVSRGTYQVVEVSQRVQQHLGSQAGPVASLGAHEIVSAWRHPIDKLLLFAVRGASGSEGTVLVYDERHDCWTTESPTAELSEGGISPAIGELCFGGAAVYPRATYTAASGAQIGSVVIGSNGCIAQECIGGNMPRSDQATGLIETSYVSPFGLAVQGRVTSVGVIGGRVEGFFLQPPNTSATSSGLTLEYFPHRFYTDAEDMEAELADPQDTDETNLSVVLSPSQYQVSTFKLRATVDTGCSYLSALLFRSVSSGGFELDGSGIRG